MSEKKTGKRLLSWVLVLIMALSMLPLNVLADEGDYVFDDANTAKSATDVTATKTRSGPDSEGNYTITLSVTGTTKDHTEQNDLPADVVLVVDSSGSMKNCVLEEHEHENSCYNWTPTATTRRCDYTDYHDSIAIKPWSQDGKTGYTHLTYSCILGDDGQYYVRQLVKGDTPICGKQEHNHGNGCVSRMSLAKVAAAEFVNGLLTDGSQIKVGLADFSGETHVCKQLVGVDGKDGLITAINSELNANHSDGTSYKAGLKAAKGILENGSNTQKFIVFVSDGKPNNGNYGTKIADQLKRSGVTIMTVGIDLADDQADDLKNISSVDDNNQPLYYGAAATALSDVLNKLRETITNKIYAGTGAVMTDVINTDKFDFVEFVTADNRLTNDNGTLTWNIGNIGQERQYVSFKVRLKDGNTEAGEFSTNTDVNLTFKSSKLNGADVKFTESAIGKPSVKIYSVTYKDTDGSVFETVSNLKEGDPTPQYTPAKRENYTFVGWTPSVDPTIGGSTYEIVYTAKWEANEYTVTWKNWNGDVLKTDENVSYGTTPEYNGNEPTKAEDENNTYTFLGWNTDQNATTKLETLPNVTADVTYYAIFSATAIPKYTLTYKANGGSGAPAAVSDNKAGDTVDLDYSNQPTHDKQGGKDIIFIGWTETNDSGKVYSNGETLPSLADKVTFANSDIIVYAVWGLDDNGNGVPDALEAKVTYKVENGYWYDAATGQAAGSEIVCLRPLYKKSASDVWEPCNATLGDSIPTGRAGNAGYTADGWYKNAETTTTTIDAATPVTGNVTYTFKYVPEIKPDTYTVVLHLDGGTYTTAPEYTKTTDGYQYCLRKATDKVNPTITTLNKNGYQFKGWSLSGTAPQALIGADETFASLSVQQNGLNGNHGKIDLYAVWQEIKYTVTYNLDGGTTTSNKTIFPDLTYGVDTPTIVNPTKAGYTFAGWEPKVAKKVTDNATYKAQWNRNYVPYYPPVPPTVKIEDDDALGLNTTDHFAYIVGYGNGEVRPQNNITRAEVATIFFRLLTDDVRDENLTKTNRYSDVAATAWYNTAVSTLSSMGIITGYPDGTFRPNAAITRAEFAAIAARFDNDGDKTAAKFSDIATHWAKDEISIAYNNGWITGYPDGTFGPQRDITRAETMTLVNRVLNRQPETEDDLLPNMTVWTDNANPKAWYYLAVQEATNSHYYKFKTNSKYEKWTELRETRDWTQLEK